MKLTDKDKKYLSGIGVHEEDFAQIGRAAACTKYELLDSKASESMRKLTVDEVITKVGRNMWLDGLARSAFHWTAVRPTKSGKNYVYFDSHSLFN